MKDNTNRKGVIAVIIFLAIILLPVCYAAYKEYTLRQQHKALPEEQVHND